MKKIYILSIILTLTTKIISQNNIQSHYVSELFNHTLSKNIHANLDTKFYNNIYATSDSVLFIINQQGFKDKTLEGHAKLTEINLFTGFEKTCFIALPPTFIENGGKIEHVYIWAIAGNNSMLCLAVDEGIWVYRYTASKQYEYFKTIKIENIEDMKINNNILHAFIYNDNNLDWMKINLSSNEIDTVRRLELTNHFFLQIYPAKIVSISNNALYLLQQNEPAIEKYSLTGELLTNYHLEIPDWKKIPDNITHTLDSIEDITERNYAFAKFSIFENNFMHLFYAFPCERFFMIAVDHNKAAETYITPYFVQIIGDSTIIEPYFTNLSEDKKFGEKYFPFLTALADGNLVFAQAKEYIAQVNKGATVSWQNKTQKEYKREVNLFYRDNEPVEQIETYRFVKNFITVDSIRFLDYDDNIFLLNDIENDKAIFIISQYPQCSACIKVIWNYFSHKKLNNVALYNIASDCETYLLKKENIKEVKLSLKTEFTPLFINIKKINAAMQQILSQKSNPVILLFDKKLQHIEIISSSNIIGDLMGNLKSSFIHRIDNFAEN